VRDGVTGYLVPVHDPDAVASRLTELLKDPGAAATMGRRGRDVFESEYTLERYLARVAKAIRGAAETAGPDSRD
jgi:glycosyltransferase involved in cell wall biosynthesis